MSRAIGHPSLNRDGLTIWFQGGHQGKGGNIRHRNTKRLESSDRNLEVTKFQVFHYHQQRNTCN